MKTCLRISMLLALALFSLVPVSHADDQDLPSILTDGKLGCAVIEAGAVSSLQPGDSVEFFSCHDRLDRDRICARYHFPGRPRFDNDGDGDTIQTVELCRDVKGGYTGIRAVSCGSYSFHFNSDFTEAELVGHRGTNLSCRKY